MIYGTAERIIMRRTNLFLFESNFARSAYQASIGTPRAVVRVVPNGVSAADSHPVAPAGSRTDVIAIGELRYIKAIDVLIEAIAQLSSAGRHITATVVGEGPDGQALRQLAAQRGLANAVRFARLPACAAGLFPGAPHGGGVPRGYLCPTSSWKRQPPASR